MEGVTNIISILILAKSIVTSMKLFQYRSLCLLVTMFKHSLNNTAAIGVDSEVGYLPVESLDDKLDMFSWDSFDCLLDDVVSILVFDTFKDMPI